MTYKLLWFAKERNIKITDIVKMCELKKIEVFRRVDKRFFMAKIN